MVKKFICAVGLILLSTAASSAQSNPGFVDGLTLCAVVSSVFCQSNQPSSSIGLNQAFTQKMDYPISGSSVTGLEPIIVTFPAGIATVAFDYSHVGVFTGLQTFNGGISVTSSFTATGLVTNADLVNPSTTVNGQTCTLGSTCTVAFSATIGTTVISGGVTNQILYDNGGILGNITKGNSCVYVTNGTGVPSCATTLPTGLSTVSFSVTGAASCTLTTVSHLTVVNGIVTLCN